MWMNRAALSLAQHASRRAHVGRPGLSASLTLWRRGAGVTTAPLSRSVWSTGQEPFPIDHVSSALTPSEISTASSTVKAALGGDVRFVAISLAEGSKYATSKPRQVDVIVLKPNGLGCEVLVDLASQSVVSSKDLVKGVQPMFTPEDCDLAEEIAKSSPELKKAVEERYGITNIQDFVAADPWSVNLANADDEMLATDPTTGEPRRLVQTFLYYRPSGNMADNQYAHPIDIVPVVDLNSKSLVRIDGLSRPAPKIPDIPVQYHRDRLSENTYLQSSWRSDTLKALHITQPDGPSFTVSDGNLVEWQGWSLRVGFNYREGIVLHDVSYQGRPVMKRGSLVEMSVPYADPNPPYQRKCGT